MKGNWRTDKPPNEQVVEVEHEGRIIRVLAFYGRDGYRPHWRSADGNIHWDVSAFTRWRFEALTGDPQERR